MSRIGHGVRINTTVRHPSKHRAGRSRPKPSQASRNLDGNGSSLTSQTVRFQIGLRALAGGVPPTTLVRLQSGAGPNHRSSPALR
jgi:hypothetical protein